ncbi:MAG TPA: hypothetical protein DEO84_01830 [candidate division Zixibacteria bacterium]|nr:hypothetical protein [candidate division Zixibacteria bacterium]HBZ00038.1 hypothetical protein [candidate division Zixibacteria bacterium]
MLSKKIFFTVCITFAFSLSFAKKAPNPGSIVPGQYVSEQSGPAQPLQDRYTPEGKAKALYYPSFSSNYSDLGDIVSDFLNRNSALLGIANNSSELRLISSKRSLAGYHYRYQQVWQGVPIFASHVLVNIRHDGVISSVISDYKTNADISTSPSLSANSAKDIAVRELGVTKFTDEPKSELVIYANDITPTLCWLVSIVAEKPLGDWQVFVNAIDGRVVAKKNIMCFVDGSGMVFNPNPVVSEQNTLLADSSNRDYPALTNARFNMTLQGLNAPSGGYYYLSGEYVNTTATSNRAHFTTPDSFNFTRSNVKFEETMAYFQIDSCARFYRALGFSTLMDYSITLAVNGVTDDNSWFTPSNHRITYGSGGVDDAEDGDVIVHEYGHATQFDQVPNWGQTEEGGAMGEGFGDYLTVSFFHPISGGWHEAQVFDWDANTRDNFWSGRRVDGNKHYPQNMDGEVHDDGEIWSRCLWDMQNSIGYDTTLQVILEGQYSLTPSATFVSAANAIVQADWDLYGGRHVMAIGQAFLSRGIFTSLPYHLDITHSSLRNTENEIGPYNVFATVTHTNPVDSMWVNYRYGADSNYSSIAMSPTGTPNEYLGLMPGPGLPDSVHYYIRALDSLGIGNTLPSNPRLQTFRFYTGPDTTPPIITHTPLVNIPTISWPPTLSATITDDYSLDSVWVEFEVNSGPFVTVPMIRVDTTNVWRCTLTGTVSPLDIIQYRIKARDTAILSHIAYKPLSGYYSFNILESQTISYMRSGFDIPDGSSNKLDTIIVTEHLKIYAVDIYVNITHPRIGDLIFYVNGGSANRRITLHNRTGGDGDSIVGWYDDDITPDGPGTLTAYNSDSCQGRWILYIADRVSGEAGHLNSWGVRIVGTGAAQAVEDDDASLPVDFAISQNYPNPFNPSTKIAFAIPQAGPVKLELFDLLGRKIATLLDGSLEAGRHTIEWDGKSESGNTVSSGIYFARLKAGDKSGLIRMTLLK